jgi:hypothetical protein
MLSKAAETGSTCYVRQYSPVQFSKAGSLADGCGGTGNFLVFGKIEFSVRKIIYFASKFKKKYKSQTLIKKRNFGPY